jgi:hypothetical protein
MVIPMKPKSTGTSPTASASAIGKSNGASIKSPRKYPYLAICVHNKGNEASLELGKAYRVIKPLSNDPPQRIRVIDEEQEDYLYLANWFVPIDIPAAEKRKVLQIVGG